MTELLRFGAVLPIWGVHDDGACRCRQRERCENIGKHPFTPLARHGVHDATRDPARIATWPKECNVAVACGHKIADDDRHLVVLDVDPRNGGDETLADLESRHGSLPETPRVLTPSGGSHYYFASALPVAGKVFVGGGLDIQGAGKYVVAPGSRHRSGGVYAWDCGAHPDDVAVADVPAWLIGGARLARSRAPRPGFGDGVDTWLGTAFAAMGWIGSREKGGIRFVVCPWADGHSDRRGRGEDDSTVILPPPRGHARIGAFSCRHGSCAGRTLRDVLERLDQHAWDAATRRYPDELDIIVRKAS